MPGSMGSLDSIASEFSAEVSSFLAFGCAGEVAQPLKVLAVLAKGLSLDGEMA